MATRIQHRRGTAASWAAANPILADGEIGIEKDTLIFKVGNGVTAWNDLIAVPGLDFETKSHASDTYASQTALAAETTARTTALAPLPSTYTLNQRSGVAFMGDSITSYNSVGGDVWHKVLCTLSNGRLRHRGFFATGGATLVGIMAEHTAPVLALSPRPGFVVLAGGTNDVGAAGYNAATSRATLLAAVATFREAGITPVLWTLPPRDDSTTVNTAVQLWNAWVRHTAQALGLPLIDAHAALVDPATGLYLSTHKLDSVHPNRAGHFAIGKAAGTDPKFLARFPDMTPYLARSKPDAPNLLGAGSGLFTAGVNGAGVPNGWANYGAASHVRTLVNDGLIPGQWCRLAQVADAAAGGGLQANFTTGWAVGDRLALALRIRMSAQDLSAGLLGIASLQQRAAGVTTTTRGPFSLGGTFDGLGFIDTVVMAGVDTIRVDLSISGTPTVDSYADFGQVTLLNLTALGL